MTMESFDPSSTLFTFIFIGAITLAIYFVLISPFLPARPRQPPTARTPASNPQHRPDAPDKTVVKAQRVPCHVAESSARIAVSGGANLLSDGLVAFRHTKACLYEDERLNAQQQAANRTERAKVLAKLLSLKEQSSQAGDSIAKTVLQAPPNKGGIVIITIPSSHVTCQKVRRVLYLLGTYYTVMLVLSVQPQDSVERSVLIEQLRTLDDPCDGVSSDVIPNHRIILASTVAGRIAVARQIERVELMLDYDAEVETQLRRFKLKAITYEATLGETLLS